MSIGTYLHGESQMSKLQMFQTSNNQFKYYVHWEISVYLQIYPPTEK